MDKNYILLQKSINNINNYLDDWSNENFLITQLILELTVPTGDSYIFNTESLVKSLTSIKILDIMPFYNDSYQPKQTDLEIKKIITFYVRKLGFPDDFFEHINDSNYRLDELWATNIASYILKYGLEFSIIRIY